MLSARSREAGRQPIFTSKPPAHSLKRPLRAQALDDGAEADAEAVLPGQDLSVEPTPPSTPVPPARGRAAWREVLVVFVIATGLTLALYHAATLSPFNTQIGGAGDADEYSWFLSWMPYAISHGLNPLVSHYLNYPGGINLMWNTSVVLPSFLMQPLTVIFGAAFAYNTLAMSGFVLTVTFSYVAFRRWVGPVPAFVGALIPGYSPYMIAQSAGHLAQILLMSAPLIVIMLDRLLVVQSGKAWLDGLLFGLICWAQLLTSEEIFAMEAVTAAIGVAALCAISWRQAAAHARYAGTGLATSAASFAVLAGPFLAVQYLGPFKVQDVHPPNAYVSDLLNFIVPTNITKFAPIAAINISSHFTGNGSEDNAYIGVPLLLFIAVTLWLARRRRVTWVALAAGGGSAILSMGPTVHWDGHVTHINLPDYYLQKLPVLHNLLADRFASVMMVAVGLLVALGCQELGRLVRPAMALGWLVVALGLVALFPITDFPAAASPLYSAFSSGLSCPPSSKGSPHPPVALLVPAANEMDLRWQAETKFCFVMPSATGMTGTNPGDVQGQGVLLTLGSPYVPPTPLTPAMRAQAAQEIQSLGISEIVVVPEFPTSPPWSPHGQALAVVWVEWLLGQTPQQSHDSFLSYVWKNLPSAHDIASGHVARLPGLPPP